MIDRPAFWSVAIIVVTTDKADDGILSRHLVATGGACPESLARDGRGAAHAQTRVAARQAGSGAASFATQRKPRSRAQRSKGRRAGSGAQSKQRQSPGKRGKLRPKITRVWDNKTVHASKLTHAYAPASAASLGSADTDFLESNAARPNVVVLPSGLQYEPIVKAAPGGLHPKVYDACGSTMLAHPSPPPLPTTPVPTFPATRVRGPAATLGALSGVRSPLRG